MTERRRGPAAGPPVKIKQLEARLARLETELDRVRAPSRVQESLDRLAQTLSDSQRRLAREVGLLTRSLKAGVKAGRAAYRGRRR